MPQQARPQSAGRLAWVPLPLSVTTGLATELRRPKAVHKPVHHRWRI